MSRTISGKSRSGIGRAVDAAADGLGVDHELHRAELDHVGEAPGADDRDGAGAASHVERLADRARAPDHLDRVVDAAPTREVAHRLHRVGAGRVDRLGRAAGPGELELRGDPVDGDDRLGTRESRALHRGEPDTTTTDDRDARARFDVRAVAHRAHAGHDTATDQGGEVERKIGVDANACGFGQDRLFAEGRGTERRQQADVVAVGCIRHRECMVDTVLAQLRVVRAGNRSRPGRARPTTSTT